MDIKSVFTDEATKLLETESKRMANDLREAAVNEALRSRGEPVEVTASDVRKAQELFRKQEAKLPPPRGIMLLKIYALFGGLVFFLGLLYPSVREFIFKRDLTSRLSLMVAIAGLFIALVSLFLAWYFETMLQSRPRRVLEEKQKKESKQ
jgi:hypothetical protein